MMWTTEQVMILLALTVFSAADYEQMARKYISQKLGIDFEIASDSGRDCDCGEDTEVTDQN